MCGDNLMVSGMKVKFVVVKVMVLKVCIKTMIVGDLCCEQVTGPFFDIFWFFGLWKSQRNVLFNERYV